MLVTALNSRIGYDKAAYVAKRAFDENKTLKEVLLDENLLSQKEIDTLLDPSSMVGPH